MLKVIRTIVFLSYGIFLGYALNLSITDYRLYVMALFGSVISAIGYSEGRKEEKELC